MKKRSLFAAVAMLIVSAMVLTSATYAWFAAGGNAAITTWSINTCEAGTGVQLKTTLSTAKWKNTLASSDFGVSGTDDAIASEYHPVSSQAGTSFKAFNIQTNNAFKQDTGTITGYYTTYYFYVGTIAAGDDVDATFTLSGDNNNSAAAAARAAVFTKAAGASSWTAQGVFCGDSGDAAQGSTTYAVTSDFADDTVFDDNVQDAIMDSTETGGSGLAAQTLIDASSGATISLTAPGQVGNTSGNTEVKVVVWLEGNDSSCTAVNAADKTISTAWSFQVHQTQQGG